MKLKNLMLVMAAAGALTACSSSDDATEGNGGGNGNNGNGGMSEVWKDFTGSQVYVGVESLGDLQKIGVTSTRADEDATIGFGYENAFNSPTATATYVVYVDPRSGYPESINKVAVEVATANVYTDVPSHEDNKNPGQILGTVKTPYVMSTNGSGVEPFMTTKPTVAQVKALLDAYYTKGTAQSSYCGYNKWTKKNYEEHIIWYLATNENGVWTVEGILTDREDLASVNEINKDELKKEVQFHHQSYDAFTTNYADGNIKAIDPTLRFDIAQQEHKTWGEIKTSLHIQESKDVTVTLPIEKCYIMDGVKDPTAVNGMDTTRNVKVFGQLYYTNGKEGAQTNVSVELSYEGDKVTIKVPAIAPELLAAAARKYNDGITVEVHTFYKLTADSVVAKAGKEVVNTELKEVIWNKLKTATISYNGNGTGRIISAYYTPDKKNAKGEVEEWGGINKAIKNGTFGDATKE